ncbi:MAG: AmmeMemoRadiSam system protein B [Syntrophales bacterium]
MKKDVRRSILAGSWYPGRPETLRGDIETYFRNVPEREIPGRVIGLVAPHAGYVYSGQVAAHAYKLIRDASYEKVIVISPSHRMHFDGVALWRGAGYETPLGVVPVDQELAESLLAADGPVAEIPAAHEREHALEIQLPFLQAALGEFTFVPLVMGTQDEQTCRRLAEVIAAALAGRKALIVGSSDLSHFHSHDEAVRLDSVVLDHLKSFSPDGLLRDLARHRCEACGGGPAAVTMMAARALGADWAELLKYADSGDVTGDRREVVGYASAVFYADSRIVKG